ncbi:hypothetical protein ATL10_10712 [Bacillus sp. 196mf]|nr:hypothetical protein ATL10_10712 [Bacillus sp. 196mf]
MSSGNRWRAAYRKNGVLGLRDTRIENAGRTLEKELTLEEKYARLEAERNLLKAEVSLPYLLQLATRLRYPCPNQDKYDRTSSLSH